MRCLYGHGRPRNRSKPRLHIEAHGFRQGTAVAAALAKLLFNTVACIHALLSGGSLPRGFHLHGRLLFALPLESCAAGRVG